MLRKTVALAGLAALVTACATSPTGRKQLMLVSEQQAISDDPKTVNAWCMAGALASKMMPYYQAPGARPTHRVRVGAGAA